MAIETSTTNTSTVNDVGDFHEQLKAVLPRLRIYALSLTRNRDAADDLVHDTVIKALAGRQSFQPGTNLAAWLFRIQRNEFISGLRRLRPTVPVDTAIAESLSHPPHQESGLVMREFLIAFAKLAPTQREALLLAVARGPALRGHRRTYRRFGRHGQEPHLARARHARAPAARRRHQAASGRRRRRRRARRRRSPAHADEAHPWQTSPPPNGVVKMWHSHG